MDRRGQSRVRDEHCYFAVTSGQHQFGYQEVPCSASFEEQIQYMKDHPKIHPGSPPSN
jgi:hypothetical protein